MLQPATRPADSRIVVLGGGVGGLTATRELDRLLRRAQRSAAEVLLVSRENFFVLPPLLFEACSGVLELRHCAQPIRPCLRGARFLEAIVQGVDVERRVVHALGAEGVEHALPYEHLVVALGASTQTALIPGSAHALTFKSVADALRLRNHLLGCFERAEAERNPARRRQLLTLVMIGGGLVGVELLGELTAFTRDVLRYYPGIAPDEPRFHLYEGGERLLRESTPFLGAYAARVLQARGAQLHVATRVLGIEPGRVRAPDGDVEAGTVVLVSGIRPSEVSATVAVTRDRQGRIVTDASLRSVSHPEVWAIGDCASVPDPTGKPYSALAQNAVREGRAVARNLVAARAGHRPARFVHRSLGTMVALGHRQAAVHARRLHLTGFLAWWIRRTYYLFQMPRWDTRLRIALDWTVALLFRPDPSKVEVLPEHALWAASREPAAPPPPAALPGGIGMPSPAPGHG
ncbi:NAD(P)/FAD-dependent oxidoreductase [Aggregicoccus sp. 17bor-14]|uniref:NAD(P)/FAD-dependent oxidoreductase n=1 Tax=Myxococcaceae TaxID=31 RepID=UPI00129CA659|nr:MULTISPECIES: FAD-dependent oxidoreductase [Myxococcaceae]MBF5042049.1 FAD-dependent oxidoreductase [Simulacricoccus sp. 17bor-14]MRI87827.1 NAD(P)/FAD-dependent oxidoreductase [Aggregicoccus sp. 17bor-14]